MVIAPNRAPRQAPLLLAINYFGNHTLLRDPRIRLSEAWMPERGEGVVDHRSTEASRGTWAEIWRIEEIVDRGYALAIFYNGDVDPDSPDLRGLQKFFPVADPASRCGTIAAWAWGLQRAVDYLVTVPEIDGGRIVVTGHSRLGKAALLAAALDDRIACAIPHQAGAGGSAPSRATVALGKAFNTLDTGSTKRPETVADLNEKFPHWFNGRFKSYNGRAEAATNFSAVSPPAASRFIIPTRCAVPPGGSSASVAILPPDSTAPSGTAMCGTGSIPEIITLSN